MSYNVLEGWLALAAETKRVDRLSSSLGRESRHPALLWTLPRSDMYDALTVDSPALQNSPSSLGSSRGSSSLNTPSQNAFRFLPFLHDFAPELLKIPPRKQVTIVPISRFFDFGILAY